MEENKELERFIESLERNELSEEQQVLLSGAGGGSITVDNAVLSNCGSDDHTNCSGATCNNVSGCGCS